LLLVAARELMDEHDEFEHVAFVEFTSKDGVVHRVPVTPEQARRWKEGEEAIGFARGEPMVGEDGRLVEHHGLPEDPDAEEVEPTVLGVPLDPEDSRRRGRGGRGRAIDFCMWQRARQSRRPSSRA
jgi:hypothetical protein